MNDEVVTEKQKVSKRPRRTRGPAARQPLPSDQIGFEGQLKILRAYSNASNGGTKPVSLERIASVAQVSRPTASSCNAFFAASNFIVKVKEGYKPTEGLLSFAKQIPWNEEKAKGFLREMMKEAWYKKELHVLFGVTPVMTEDELIKALGSSIGAREDQRTSLVTLVKFIAYAGLITADPDTGKFKLTELITLEGEPLPSEEEIHHRRVSLVSEEKRVRVGGVEATFAVNLNLTLDVTTGTPEEHVKKIKDILKGLGEEE